MAPEPTPQSGGYGVQAGRRIAEERPFPRPFLEEVSVAIHTPRPFRRYVYRAGDDNVDGNRKTH